MLSFNSEKKYLLFHIIIIPFTLNLVIAQKNKNEKYLIGAYRGLQAHNNVMKGAKPSFELGVKSDMVVTGWLVAAQESRDVSIIISLINDYILRPPVRCWTLPCAPDTWKVEGINQSKTMNPVLSPFTLLAVR